MRSGITGTPSTRVSTHARGGPSSSQYTSFTVIPCMTSHSYGTLNYFGHIYRVRCSLACGVCGPSRRSKGRKEAKKRCGSFSTRSYRTWPPRSRPYLATPQFHATDLPHVSGHERLLPLLCKIVTYRSRHLDIGPRDVLSYMLTLVSSSVPLSSSVSSAEG
jgi:hypothetical protein